MNKMYGAEMREGRAAGNGGLWGERLETLVLTKCQ
jgi:hypothetical protein